MMSLSLTSSASRAFTLRVPLPTYRRAYFCFHRNISILANNSELSFNGSGYPYRWLRDACQCPLCVHPSTSQKLHRTSDIPLDIKPQSEGIIVSKAGLRITWKDRHQSFYSTSFLEQHSSPERLEESHRDVKRIPWDGSAISTSPNLFLPYDSLQSLLGLLTAITQLSQFGLLLVSGVPSSETSDETCELRKLAGHFGELRHTFYGELWDVRNIRNSKNVAYTNLDLGLHMDLLYFEHPPRYQILHCLRNRVVGGTSVFVDALQAATMLREWKPEAFETLVSTPVAFHYINDGHHLHYSHPTIELARSLPGSSPYKLPIAHINYSPPFQAPLALSTPTSFYQAMGDFTRVLAKPELTFNYLLNEGDAVLFDNRRVLHARMAFRDKEGGGGETNRWLKGCYLEADALLDRGRMLKIRMEKGEFM